MRRYELPPAIVAALRGRSQAVAFKEVGVPLYLELDRGGLAAPSCDDVDADDGRVEAEGFLIDPDEDDDFY